MRQQRKAGTGRWPAAGRTTHVAPFLLLAALMAMFGGPGVPDDAQAQAASATPIALSATSAERPRNLILLIGDGMGPAYITLGRELLDRPLALDTLIVGTAATAALDTRVTDSAASSTALATGVRTRNRAISVDAGGRPLRTLFEAAHEGGFATGLVTTSRITHATPAAFATHVVDRGLEADIAEQLLDSEVEVLLGGGWNYFLPESGGGRRKDGAHLLERAVDAGRHVVRDAASLAVAPAGRLIGLFAASHMAYVLDRGPSEPDLVTMTRVALGRLAGGSTGFILVVEGARIDHAGHSNDAAAAAREVLEFDAAVRLARDFAREDGATLVLATADHETGGLSLGAMVGGKSLYEFRPEVLRGARSSAERMAERIDAGESVAGVLAEGAGLDDLTAAELEGIAGASPEGDREVAIAHLTSNRAVVGWTTLGHTAVDVPVAAFGPGAGRFQGHRHLADIGLEMAALLGLHIEGTGRKP